jgi:hypothetical protein
VSHNQALAWAVRLLGAYCTEMAWSDCRHDRSALKRAQEKQSDLVGLSTIEVVGIYERDSQERIEQRFPDSVASEESIIRQMWQMNGAIAGIAKIIPYKTPERPYRQCRLDVAEMSPLIRTRLAIWIADYIFERSLWTLSSRLLLGESQARSAAHVKALYMLGVVR